MEFYELGLQPYLPIWEKRKAFTQTRDKETVDECWFVEHCPVYTQGLAGKHAHLLNLGDVPLVHSDRGGQVTYHGPGQLMVYLMVDLHRLSMGIKAFIYALEDSVIQLLELYEIIAHRKCKAPGVYVQEQKIASLGLRVKNGCTYHGMALNVNMDLGPFKGINPCGFDGLRMAQMKDFVPNITLDDIIHPLKAILSHAYRRE